MRQISAVPVCLLFLVTAAVPARGQFSVSDLPIAIEASVAGGLPIGEFADARPGFGATSGFGVRAGARFGLTPEISLYGLYEYTRFGCGACDDVALGSELTDGGFAVGVRTALPLQLPGFAWWASAGALVAHKLEVTGPDGSVVSDPAFGYALGTGIEIPFASSLSLSPGIHYRSYTATFDLAFDDLFLDDPFAEPGDDTSREAEVDVSSLSLDIGLVFHF